MAPRPESFAAQAATLPLAAIVYTDIAKDGMLTGPNVTRTQALAEHVDVPVIASGGVSRVEDIQQLAAVPVIAGVIVGRSLYEGTLTLKDALAEETDAESDDGRVVVANPLPDLFFSRKRKQAR